MTRAQFARRQALIAEGRCPRCGLLVDPWPLRRPDSCHTPGAYVCPRDWQNIRAAEAHIEARILAKERTV